MDAPPPIPPQAPKSKPRLRSLWIVLGISTLACCGFGFGTYVWFRDVFLAHKVQPPAKPITWTVGETKPDGWVNVSFPDLALSVDLPAPPVAQSFSTALEENQLNPFTQYLAGFDSSSRGCWVTIRAVSLTSVGNTIIRDENLHSICLEGAKRRDTKASFVTLPSAPNAICVGYRNGINNPPLSNLQICKKGSKWMFFVELRSSTPAQTLKDADRLFKSMKTGP